MNRSTFQARSGTGLPRTLTSTRAFTRRRGSRAVFG